MADKKPMGAREQFETWANSTFIEGVGNLSIRRMPTNHGLYSTRDARIAWSMWEAIEAYAHAENERLTSELKSSEDIRHAEKAILINEIEDHTKTKAENERLQIALKLGQEQMRKANNEIELLRSECIRLAALLGAVAVGVDDLWSKEKAIAFAAPVRQEAYEDCAKMVECTPQGQPHNRGGYGRGDCEWCQLADAIRAKAQGE